LWGCDEEIWHQEILTDDEIMHAVTKEDIEKEDDAFLSPSKISASEATNALNMAIQCAEQTIKAAKN